MEKFQSESNLKSPKRCKTFRNLICFFCQLLLAVLQMNELLFGTEPDLADLNRWETQHFVFSAEFPFVLEQTQGGPCGVLAPVQAFLMLEPRSDNEWKSLQRVLNRILKNANPDFCQT